MSPIACLFLMVFIQNQTYKVPDNLPSKLVVPGHLRHENVPQVEARNLCFPLGHLALAVASPFGRLLPLGEPAEVVVCWDDFEYMNLVSDL